jgi:hypothetical protein
MDQRPLSPNPTFEKLIGDLPRPKLRRGFTFDEDLRGEIYPSDETDFQWVFGSDLGQGNQGSCALWLKYDKETGVIVDVSLSFARPSIGMCLPTNMSVSA